MEDSPHPVAFLSNDCEQKAQEDAVFFCCCCFFFHPCFCTFLLQAHIRTLMLRAYCQSLSYCNFKKHDGVREGDKQTHQHVHSATLIF